MKRKDKFEGWIYRCTSSSLASTFGLLIFDGLLLDDEFVLLSGDGGGGGGTRLASFEPLQALNLVVQCLNGVQT